MIRFLLCSFALVLLYPTAIDLYLVGLPQIAQDLGATESQLHIAFSIYLAGMATTMLFAGKLSDTIGRKPIAISGAIIFIFASLLGGQAESSTTFLIARFTQGIGAGSCYVVAFAILRNTLDDQRRAKVLSMLNGITCIVPVIAPVIGHLIRELGLLDKNCLNSNLSLSQAHILTYIHRNGSTAFQELAAQLNVPKASLSRTLTTLIDKVTFQPGMILLISARKATNSFLMENPRYTTQISRRIKLLPLILMVFNIPNWKP